MVDVYYVTSGQPCSHLRARGMWKLGGVGETEIVRQSAGHEMCPCDGCTQDCSRTEHELNSLIWWRSCNDTVVQLRRSSPLF
jgi:hypothetical protein